MTNSHPLAALIAGVPRYIRDGHDMVKSPNGPWLHQIEVLAALEAAPVPDLVEAGKVAERADSYEVWVDGKACNMGSTIRALIALCQAQAAQIAGLETAFEREKADHRSHRAKAGGTNRAAIARAEAAEVKVAELRHKLQAMHRRAQKAEGLLSRAGYILVAVQGYLKAARDDARWFILLNLVGNALDYARRGSARALWADCHWYSAESKLMQAEVERLRGAAHDDIRAAVQLIIDRVLQEPTHEAARLRELMVNATLTIRHPSLPRYRRWMMVNEAIRTLAASLIDEAPPK